MLLTEDDFQALPEEFQRLLISRFMPVQEDGTDGEPAEIDADDGEEPPDFSPAQAKKFYAACSDRTKEVIRQIVAFPEAGFLMSDLEKKVGVGPGQLKGSWTGITKVTRRILGDDEALLIWWTEGKNSEWHGRISPMTYRSFRKVLGVI
jgi:hypothetical protein